METGLKYNITCSLDNAPLTVRISAIVFRIKLIALLHDLTHYIFGKAQYFLNVIEFQKRGLMHCHIVIKFAGLSHEARHEVDNCIWTNLPDENTANGELREKVIKNMIHQKYGDFNPNAGCMTTCSKTKTNENSFQNPFHGHLLTRYMQTRLPEELITGASITVTKLPSSSGMMTANTLKPTSTIDTLSHIIHGC